MNRIKKENLKLFRKLGLYDCLMETREMSVGKINLEYKMAKEQPFYREGSRKKQALINVFYLMALNHAQGVEKALSQHEA